MSLARRVALALLLAAAGCGSDSPALPPLTWTWVPIEGAVCSDGSPTGVGVERGPGASPNVLVFLMGGGACFDLVSCFTFPTATPGPYGASELDRDMRAIAPGSVFDRTLPGNPYRDFTFVFVPYCTGDVHAGDAVQTYPGAPRPWQHKGRVNLQRDFAYLAATLDAPAKVVVSGASAGGFGALLAFGLAKEAWPQAKGYLVDDSGPPIDAIPQATVELWYASWDLGTAVNAICGSDVQDLLCRENLSLVFPALEARYPEDRFALLSSTQDGTMRSFFGALTTAPPYFVSMDAATFESGVRDLAALLEDDTPPGESHAFVIPGTSHTMLGTPAAATFTAGGVPLLEWLRRQVEDDPAWAAAIAPAP
jgi:hypothetical protein